MNDKLDLVQILKNAPEGTELYSPIFGVVYLFKTCPPDLHQIKCREKTGRPISFDLSGRYYGAYPEGECMLFPSKECRDWSKFRIDLPRDTPVMIKSPSNDGWRLRYYAENGSAYPDGYKSDKGFAPVYWGYIIPVSEFNFENPTTEGKTNYGTYGR
ncbi:hypothetical protein [Bacteroides sedimenti]